MKKILIIALILITSSTGFALKKTEEVKVDKGNSKIFTLINSNGDVEVEGWNEDYILIEYTKVIGGFLASSKDIVVDIKEGKNIVVKTVYRKGKSNKKVDFQIKLPKNYEYVELSTLNGDIEVSSLSSNLISETSNGDIYTEQIEGASSLSTTNGDINANAMSIVEKLLTTNGNIVAEIDDISDNGAKISTINGNIVLDIPASLSSNLQVRDANSKISINNNNEKVLNASTTNGHVEINIK